MPAEPSFNLLTPPTDAASRARSTGASQVTANRTWTHRIENHARLGALVGPESLHLEFDCADDDFEFALTSSWPLNAATSMASHTGKAHANSRHADLVKLAETLNSLVRLYAIETGTTNMHVLVEARRGVVGVPAWWDGAPCLFATFAFDTNFSEVGLFTDPVQAFANAEMIMTPHRLLLAVGPARPEWSEAEDEEAWLDADSRRIAALKKVEAQISRDVARLAANTVDMSALMMDAEQGGMAMEEALMEGLARVRGAVQKMRGAILGYEHRRSKKRVLQATPHEPKVETPSPARRMRIKNDITAAMVDRQTLASTVRELQGVLKKESASPKVPLPARATFRRGLTALTTLEQSLTGNIVAPQPDKTKPKTSSPIKELMNKLSEAAAPVKKLTKKIRRKKSLKNMLEDLFDDEPEEAERPSVQRKVAGPAPRR